PDAICRGFSRRRITLATLLASCRRSMPRRSRYWLRCSREQKSSPAPDQMRLRAFPQNKQVLTAIVGHIIETLASKYQNKHRQYPSDNQSKLLIHQIVSY